MSTQAFSGAYLLPLFHAIEQVGADGAYRQLPAPAPASSLPPMTPRWARTRPRI
ncbi:hypothetical protein ACFV2Z_31895 [Streptomyces sp. NPDC059688]|uniref:hypothetical protein n=1 Tax=Streptomyces sp. NPDC059688 TaxID=3346906 RepID=UPI00367B8626